MHAVICGSKLNIHCEYVLGRCGEHEMPEDLNTTGRMYNNASVLRGTTHSPFRATAGLAHLM
jgi:hypothetical protein